MTDVKQLPKEFLAEMKLLLGDEYDRYLKSFEEGFQPGLQQAFADGIMDKGDLVRKIQELGWKVIE